MYYFIYLKFISYIYSFIHVYVYCIFCRIKYLEKYKSISHFLTFTFSSLNKTTQFLSNNIILKNIFEKRIFYLRHVRFTRIVWQVTSVPK